jgi:hypothetical protein
MLNTSNSLHRSIVLEEVSAKYAHDSRIGLAFVYFSYKEQDVQTPGNILATIIKQLVRQRRLMPDQLRLLYRKYYRNADYPSNEKLEAQLSEFIETFEQVYLVIDAIDEFDDRNSFLPMITRLVQETSSSVHFKVFMTSRREPDIETHLSLFNVPTISIEAAKVDVDIAAFVHHQLERWSEKATEFVVDKALKDEIAGALTSKSNGM